MERGEQENPEQPVGYLVSSHFSYAPLALPRLLPSLRACGIPREHVFVIVCGCRREFEQQGPDCTFWFVEHESRNFCTFVEAINPVRAAALSPFSHLFCLLDTCEAGPEFKIRTSAFDRALDAVAAHPFRKSRLAQSDLAAYSRNYLATQSEVLASFRNVTPEQNFDWEGEIFHRAERRAFYGGTGGQRITAGPRDIYGTGTCRITEHYTAVDLYHFKSNWGQNGRRLLDRI